MAQSLVACNLTITSLSALSDIQRSYMTCRTVAEYKSTRRRRGRTRRRVEEGGRMRRSEEGGIRGSDVPGDMRGGNPR